MPCRLSYRSKVSPPVCTCRDLLNRFNTPWTIRNSSPPTLLSVPLYLPFRDCGECSALSVSLGTDAARSTARQPPSAVLLTFPQSLISPDPPLRARLAFGQNRVSSLQAKSNRHASSSATVLSTQRRFFSLLSFSLQPPLECTL